MIFNHFRTDDISSDKLEESLQHELKELHEIASQVERTQAEWYKAESWIMARMARILSIISRKQEEAAKKMERQTNKLIVLTWVLAILTFALLAVESRAIVFPQKATEQPQVHQTAHDGKIVLPPVPKGQNTHCALK